MTEEQASGRCSCQCGRVAASVTGKPILPRCATARLAGRRGSFAQEPGAPSSSAVSAGLISCSTARTALAGLRAANCCASIA